jgi:hypothetical protein
MLENGEVRLWKKLYTLTLILGLVIIISGLSSPNPISQSFYVAIGILELGSSALGLRRLEKPESVIVVSWLLFAFAVSFLLIVPGPAYSAPPAAMAAASLCAVIIGAIGLYGILGISRKYNLPVAP